MGEIINQVQGGSNYFQVRKERGRERCAWINWKWTCLKWLPGIVRPLCGSDVVVDDGPARQEVQQDGHDQGGHQVGGGRLLGELVLRLVGRGGDAGFDLTEVGKEYQSEWDIELTITILKLLGKLIF